MQRIIDVTYMELRTAPNPMKSQQRSEHVATERLKIEDYLSLYQQVGRSLRWNQRTAMPRSELQRLLASEELSIHVLHDSNGEALGFCEFSYRGLPEIELKNFGLVPAAYGRGLGPWLLGIALEYEWQRCPSRIWLHTDTWDHPAAVSVYKKAGFRVVQIKRECADEL